MSLAFWLPLEIYQMDTLGHPTLSSRSAPKTSSPSH